MAASAMENLGGLLAGIIVYHKLAFASTEGAAVTGTGFAGDPTQIGDMGVAVVGVLLAQIKFWNTIYPFQATRVWRAFTGWYIKEDE